MSVATYMSLFFFMVILGLVMVVATIILIAFLASRRSKPKKINKPFRIIYFSLWGVFFGMFAAIGTTTPTNEADRIEAEVFAQMEAEKNEEAKKVFASIPLTLVVTWGEVEALDGGMRYEEVVSAIGIEGELVDADKSADSELTTYKWENSPTSWLLVNFTKDNKGNLYLYNFYTMGIQDDVY